MTQDMEPGQIFDRRPGGMRATELLRSVYFAIHQGREAKLESASVLSLDGEMLPAVIITIGDKATPMTVDECERFIQAIEFAQKLAPPTDATAKGLAAFIPTLRRAMELSAKNLERGEGA